MEASVADSKPPPVTVRKTRRTSASAPQQECSPGVSTWSDDTALCSVSSLVQTTCAARVPHLAQVTSEENASVEPATASEPLPQLQAELPSTSAEASNATPDDQVDEENEENAAADSSIIRLCDVDFAFLDANNVSCGLCGEITAYKTLFGKHLAYNHPQVLKHKNATSDLASLQRTLDTERRAIINGFGIDSKYDHLRKLGVQLPRPTTAVRIRANMSLPELQGALKYKIREKLNRSVPITLIDKAHVRCGICNTVVSINKRFEITHIVRHFKAWHPTSHECAGQWLQLIEDKDRARRMKKHAVLPKNFDDRQPLSDKDFHGWDWEGETVLEPLPQHANNLQCHWCGAFLDGSTIAAHFESLHSKHVRVPRCGLCLREVLLNAQMTAQFGGLVNFEIICLDETHLHSEKFDCTYKSERQMIKNFRQRISEETATDDSDSDENEPSTEQQEPSYRNSGVELGKSLKPKRSVVMPAFRQAAPADSEFVQPMSECHWKCRVCEHDIYAAVISAGAIKHFRKAHPDQADQLQYELVKARLERVSDGCMEFMNPTLVECLLCQLTFTLHVRFNISRAVRHLRSRHPSLMPENSSSADDAIDPNDTVKTSRLVPFGGAKQRAKKRKHDKMAVASELHAMPVVSSYQVLRSAIGITATTLKPLDQSSVSVSTAGELVAAAGPSTKSDEHHREPNFDVVEPNFESGIVEASEAPAAVEEYQVHHVENLEQLQEMYGVDLSKVRVLTDEHGQQYVLVDDDNDEQFA